MSKDRAVIAMQYRVRLIGPDGAEWEWRVTDSYFKRRMKKIEAEMLETIRKHDLSYEFGLNDHEPKFTTCSFCNATSTSTRKRHRTDCTRPRGGDNARPAPKIVPAS